MSQDMGVKEALVGEAAPEAPAAPAPTVAQIAKIDFPGQLALANSAGFHHGLKGERVSSLAALNEWPESHPRHLMVHIETHGEGFFILYTKRLTQEQEQDFEEVTREVNAMMNERREKRAAQEVSNQLAKEAFVREQNRLAGIGAKYEARVKQIRSMPDGKEKKEAFRELNSGVLPEEGAPDAALP